MISKRLIQTNLIKALEVPSRPFIGCVCPTEMHLKFDVDGIRLETFICKEGWEIVLKQGFLELTEEAKGEEDEESISNRN